MDGTGSRLCPMTRTLELAVLNVRLLLPLSFMLLEFLYCLVGDVRSKVTYVSAVLCT